MVKAEQRPVPREVAVALPYRQSGSDVEFLVVSSRKHANRFLFPKGGVEDGEDGAQAAVREAWEEAGIKGTVLRELTASLDTKPHKRSPAKSATSAGVDSPFIARASYRFYLVVVEDGDIFSDWPERHERERNWVSRAEAKALVAWREDGQVAALEMAADWI